MMATIDEDVQAVMADSLADHRQRAVVAAQLIEGHVRNEFGVHDEPLPIPLTWEHKVPADHAQRAYWSEGLGSEPIEWNSTVMAVATGDVESLEVVEVPPAAKTAFDSLWDDDDDEETKQRKFNEFWDSTKGETDGQ